MDRSEKEIVYDTSELVRDFLRTKGYLKTLEYFENEDKQKSKQKVKI